ncbi:MAG: hypothetical protein KKF12_12250 [Proteobacteria bacterium]|nr:hypothetical protein [Desulfobacula sp.]MBU3951016.1 hypothetical protein [Pseudomonadota bacterium]MBU4131584.1 hypothetical protein [Pseudomonadota bacterium]
MKKWKSIPEFAKEMGFSPQYIRKLVESGKIEKTATKPNGKRFLIDPVLAKKQMKNNVSYVGRHAKPQEEQTGPTPAETIAVVEKAGLQMVSLSKAQTRRANYEAALKKLELEEKTGELVSAEKVDLDFFNIARLVRDAILNIPSRIGAELASITDVHLVNERLTTELNAALEELAR